MRVVSVCHKPSLFVFVCPDITESIASRNNSEQVVFFVTHYRSYDK